MGTVVDVYVDRDDAVGDLHVVIGDKPAYALGSLLLVTDGGPEGPHSGVKSLVGLAALDPRAQAVFKTNLRHHLDYGFDVTPLVAGDLESGLLVVGSAKRPGAPATEPPIRSFVL